MSIEQLFDDKYTHYISLFRDHTGFALLVSSHGMPSHNDPGYDDDEDWFHGPTIDDVLRQAAEFFGLVARADATV